jgi:hypothetical protein
VENRLNEKVYHYITTLEKTNEILIAQRMPHIGTLMKKAE